MTATLPYSSDYPQMRMTPAMSKLSPEEIGLLALRFAPEGILEAPVPFGGGHINDTYLVFARGGKGGGATCCSASTAPPFRVPRT